MKISALLAAASTAILMATSAQAAKNYLVQLEDTEVNGTVTGNTYEDGILIQSVDFCCETLESNYGLWNDATLLASFTAQYNFWEVTRDGSRVLSDTSELTGVAGDRFFHITFRSDGGPSPLVPYVGGIDVIETGDWQDIVSPGVVSNGDYYQVQMRSDIDPIPEPTTWALMLAGLGGLGVALRSRREDSAAA